MNITKKIIPSFFTLSLISGLLWSLHSCDIIDDIKDAIHDLKDEMTMMTKYQIIIKDIKK